MTVCVIWKCLQNFVKMKLLILCSVFSLVLLTNGKLDRPRGVPISKASFYVAGADFTCLDGSSKVRFDHINDDYCDCRDGSDEPGTSACPNGSFHCTNAGHAPLNIPSSRVNDGICDCCDGTDEYDSRVQCQNTCRELGKTAREEREKMKALVKEGNKIYQEYSQLGTDAKKERQAELSDLKRDKEVLEARKNELQSMKEEAELPEKEAKDEHKKKWDEEKAQIQQERDEKKCEDAFKELDYNGDATVSLEEMKLHPEFDIDSNGEVTEEEAKEYLEDKDSVDFYTFQTEVWPNIKDIYKKPDPKTTEGEDQEEPVQEETKQVDLTDVEDDDTSESVESVREIQQQIAALHTQEMEIEKEFRAKVKQLLDNKEVTEANDMINQMTNKTRKLQEKRAKLVELKQKVRKEERDREQKSYSQSIKELEEEKVKLEEDKVKAKEEKRKLKEEEKKEEIRKLKEEKKKLKEEERKKEEYARQKYGKPGTDQESEHLPRSDDPVTDIPVDNEPVRDFDSEHDDEADSYDREEDDSDRYDDEDGYDEYDDDEERDDDIRPDSAEDENMPEYDDNTKILMAAADKARAEFNEAESQFKAAESKLNDMNRFLSLDLGSENEFFPIKDSCYEFTDREYTYKFCPYDKATQRSKSGGSETSLGRWGRWDGPEGNRYAVMLLENGQGCWNGPNRSVKVHIKCGVNNELIAASEPNRCEYEYQFLSPAACKMVPEDEPNNIHEEL